MKKKIFFALATSFFAVATVFNMGMLQSGNTSDVSLESIAVMAQAQSGESNELPDVTVYGCSRWATIVVNGKEVYGCARWSSDEPCENLC
jgi:Zn-dependent M28 family amino/carboxypeptidase